MMELIHSERSIKEQNLDLIEEVDVYLYGESSDLKKFHNIVFDLELIGIKTKLNTSDLKTGFDFLHLLSIAKLKSKHSVLSSFTLKVTK